MKFRRTLSVTIDRLTLNNLEIALAQLFQHGAPSDSQITLEATGIGGIGTKVTARWEVVDDAPGS